MVVGEQPSEQMKRAVISLEEAFDEISGKVIIMKCDVNSAICQKLLTLFNIKTENAQKHPYVGIIDLSLNDKNESMLKYQPIELSKEDDITTEILKSFVSRFSKKELEPILKFDPEPQSPAPSDLPVLALNTYTFKTVLTDYPDKDIFIFFAGPACFNCNAVWPSFEKTVRALHEGSKSILFAYVDL